MRALPAVLPLVLLVGACSTYDYNRAALVPRATPRMSTGQPLAGKAQLSLGASSVAHLGDPSAGDQTAGLEVPGTQLFGSLSAKLTEGFSMGFFHERGLAKGSRALHADQPPVESDSVGGYGVSVDLSIPTGDPRFHIGLGLDAMLWLVPYVEYRIGTSFTDVDYGSDSVGTLAASVTPSFRATDAVTVFGGVTLRQHPTLDQKGTVVIDPGLSGTDVESGPANVIVSGGVEVSLADGTLLASAMAYMDVSRDPVKYGPGAALMLSIPLGKRGPATAQPPQPQQPPPGYAPPPPPGYAPPPPPGYAPPPPPAPPAVWPPVPSPSSSAYEPTPPPIAAPPRSQAWLLAPRAAGSSVANR
jgi:hypothetical protein